MWCLRSSGRVPQDAGDDLAMEDRYRWPDDLRDRPVVADECGNGDGAVSVRKTRREVRNHERDSSVIDSGDRR